MSWFTPSLVLRGDYTGQRDAFISFRFRFCDDGTYYYVVQQGDRWFTLWRFAHRGRWRLGSARHGTSKSVTTVCLEPQFLDAVPEDRTAKPLLVERGLPTDRAAEYVVNVGPAHERWNAKRDDCSLVFCVPIDNPDKCPPSWTLVPATEA